MEEEFLTRFINEDDDLEDTNWDDDPDVKEENDDDEEDGEGDLAVDGDDAPAEEEE